MTTTTEGKYLGAGSNWRKEYFKASSSSMMAAWQTEMMIPMTETRSLETRWLLAD